MHRTPTPSLAHAAKPVIHVSLPEEYVAPYDA